MEKLDLERALRLVDAGYLKMRQHELEDLWIWNYTPQTQFEQNWNDITRACRGLITDGKGNIVARPFPKFFNYHELNLSEIPAGPFEVFEKFDGSLGVMYWIGDRPYIASRGSFNSEQANFATNLLHERYAETIPLLNPEHTYLFEIIYPENRVVVDYYGMKDIILLAVIDTKTGEERRVVEDWGFVYAAPHDYNNLQDILEYQDDNREGFVIKYRSGFRLKVKFDEYVRLHRLVTQVSTKSIWKHMREGRSLDELIDRVPDEFYQWVKEIKDRLQGDFDQIVRICKNEYQQLETRKETAAYFNRCQYPSVLFAMLDGKEYDDIIWKRIKPKFERPFKDQRNAE